MNILKLIALTAIVATVVAQDPSWMNAYHDDIINKCLREYADNSNMDQYLISNVCETYAPYCNSLTPYSPETAKDYSK